jgi:hypothetical protein
MQLPIKGNNMEITYGDGAEPTLGKFRKFAYKFNLL